MDATRDKTLARFWAKVDKTDGCWNWTGAYNVRHGYGRLKHQARYIYVHRFAYELSNGTIPAGMTIDHACRNRLCVNPAHLRLANGSQQNQNRPYTNEVGIRGVSAQTSRGRRTGRFIARAMKDGATHLVPGSFSTAAEAGEAARQLRLRLFTHNDYDRR